MSNIEKIDFINRLNLKHDVNCDCDECNHEHNEKYDADGIDNKEHLLDMFSEADVLYQNIKDNTDSAFAILKNLEGKEDEDILDVIRINCSEILEVEKQTKDIFDNIKKIEISLKENLETLSDGKISLIDEYFEALQKWEMVSNESFEKLLKRLD